MKEIDELQQRLSQLEQRNAQLETRNTQLEEKVDGISVTGDGMSGTVGGGGMMYVDPNAQSVGGGGSLGTLEDIIIGFNGTLYYTDLNGVVTGPV